MKIKNEILSFIGKSCTACVGLSLLFYIVMEIIFSTSIDRERGIPFTQFLLLLLCAFLLTGASYLFRLPFPKALNLLLHFAVSFLSLFITFVASGKLVKSGATSVLVFLVLFSVLYGLCFGIFLLFRFLFFPEKRQEKAKKERQKEAEYVNRF